jgi:endonuclease/exonuclease/phosphatase (EEP) superfamily protein YafD
VKAPARGRRSLHGGQWVALFLLLPLLASCFSITVDPRALQPTPDGTIRARSLPCDALHGALSPDASVAGGALDSRAIRVLTWNVNKQQGAAWSRDLERFVQLADVVLLQEATLGSSLRDLVSKSNLQWVMASSFMFGVEDVGVLTAARVAPLQSCTLRAFEPLIRLPKSAVIDWFPVSDGRTLAVANVHAINFSTVDAYRSQLEAIAVALSGHRGPVVFAGDFNTWNDARSRVVREIADRLGLIEITFATDNRSLFFGRQLDHILVRGLEVIESSSIPVTSSDHNPVTATLRVMGG